MYQISVSEVLDRAWGLFKNHWLVLTVIYFVISIIVSAIGSICGPNVDPLALSEAIQNENWEAIAALYSNPTGSILQSVVNAILTIGFYNACIQICRAKATSVSFDMWKLSVAQYVKYIAAEIIFIVVVVIGCCLCIIPGLWLAARLQFAGYRIIENENCGVMDSLKESWEMTKGNSMNLILLFIAEFFIGLIGLCLCCIGVYPAAALCVIASVVAYLTLVGFYSEPQVEEVEA